MRLTLRLALCMHCLLLAIGSRSSRVSAIHCTVYIDKETYQLRVHVERTNVADRVLYRNNDTGPDWSQVGSPE